MRDNCSKIEYRKRLIQLILGAVIVISLYGCQAQTKEPDVVLGLSGSTNTYNYSLKEVGTIEDPSRLLSFADSYLKESVDDNFILLDYMGQKKNDCILSEAVCLTEGIYYVTEATAHKKGLISQEGEILVDCNAVCTEWPSLAAGRYLLIFYADNETSNQEMCFVYNNGEKYILGKPANPDEVTMYTGYALIYDLDNRCFVPNLVVSSSDIMAVQVCGSNLVVKKGDVTLVYSSKGEELFSTPHSVTVGGGVFIELVGGTRRVYNENGEQTFSSNKPLEPIPGHNGYIRCYDNEKYVIMDCYGNRILEAAYHSVNREYNHIFMIEEGNGKEGMVRSDGTVVLPCRNYKDISEIGYGLFCASNYGDKNSTEALVGDIGIICNEMDISHDLVMVNGNRAYVFQTSDFSLDIGSYSVQHLTDAMVAFESGEADLYGVYDLFTGAQLLPHSYETVEYAEGYLYAYRLGGWTVFKVIGPVE